MPKQPTHDQISTQAALLITAAIAAQQTNQPNNPQLSKAVRQIAALLFPTPTQTQRDQITAHANRLATAFHQTHKTPQAQDQEKFLQTAAPTTATYLLSLRTLDAIQKLQTQDPKKPPLKKLWLSRADEKVRESHRLLHGEVREIDADFKPNLKFPGDPSAPLDETIGCRCFLWAVPSEKHSDFDIETMFKSPPEGFEIPAPEIPEPIAAASIARSLVSVQHAFSKLLTSQPWLWQPRDQNGRWVEVGTRVYAPEPNQTNPHHYAEVTEIIGPNKVRVSSVRTPRLTWEVDADTLTRDRSLARLPDGTQPPPPPHLTEPIRQVRPELTGLDPEAFGPPVYRHELANFTPGDIVGYDDGYALIDRVNSATGTVYLKTPPEPRYDPDAFAEDAAFKLAPTATISYRVPDANTADTESRISEAVDPIRISEFRKRQGLLQYGFANPSLNSTTADAFKTGSNRTDWEPDRKQLHDEIISQAISVAETVPIEEATFYMMGGGPASGKSTMLSADEVVVPLGSEALQINADEIKELLPEYLGLLEADRRSAAAFTHQESSDISSRMIREVPLDRHVVLDGVGDKGAAAVEARLETPKARGQRTVANYATLPTDLAVKLSEARGRETGRYVPEAYIRSAHSDVTDTFFDLVKRNSLDEMYLWNTELWDEEKKMGIPRLIFKQIDGKAEIVDEALLIEFLNKSNSKRHSLKSIKSHVWLSEQGKLLERMRRLQEAQQPEPVTEFQPFYPMGVGLPETHQAL